MVGTMMAIEVPTQSCMRTASGTSSTRKDFVEHRHDHCAAADAEQPGEKSGHTPAMTIADSEPNNFAQSDAEQHLTFCAFREKR